MDEIHLLGSPKGVITNVKGNTVIDILMDMCNPYKMAVRIVLPNAKIVVDKFNVVKMPNKHLERVRKELRSTLTSTQRKVLKNERYALLKHRHDLSVHETINMEAWTKSFPILGEAYKLKEATHFFDTPFN